MDRYGSLIQGPFDDFEFNVDDVLTIRTSAQALVDIRQAAGLRLLHIDGAQLYAALTDSLELVEVVLDAGSPLVGRTIATARVKEVYQGGLAAYRCKAPLSRARGAERAVGIAASQASPSRSPHLRWH